MSTPTPWTWREKHAFDLACGVCFDAGRGADDPLHDAARRRAERLWDLAARAGAEAMRERCLAIVTAQPYYHDTHTGMRQQWIKDQIAAAIRALEV